MAVEQIYVRNLDKLNVISSLLHLCNGLITFNLGFFVDGALQIRYPLLLMFGIPPLYCVGPLNLFHFQSLLDPDKPIPYKTWLHFLPAVATIIFVSVFLLQPGHYQQDVLNLFFKRPMESYFTYVILLGGLFTTAYLGYLFRVEYSQLDDPGFKNEVIIVVAITLIALSATLFVNFGFFFGIQSLLVVGGIHLTAIYVLIFLAHTRHPQFFQLLKKSIQKRRYDKSLLGGVNTELINNRLMELMKEEEVFKDMDISIGSLAGMLSITPRQMSQFLNENLNMDFRNFINTCRIEEAKRMLSSEKNMNILTICFEVGFNSKSAFNTAFRRYTGMTPREFRENWHTENRESE